MLDLDNLAEKSRGLNSAPRYGPGWLILILLAVAMPWIAQFAWRIGQRDAAAISATKPRSGTKSISSTRAFRVAGSSMAPTLVGESEIAECDVCRLRWRVDVSLVEHANERMLCSHCGRDMRIVVSESETRAEVMTADVVELDPFMEGETDLMRGDLVGVMWDSQIYVKRIVALPGEVVELDGSRLTIDGMRLEDRLVERQIPFGLPRLLVDDDSRREVSRWFPAQTEVHADFSWQRATSRVWEWNQASMSPWLVYQHKSVYDNERPSRVWDDYQINIGIQRKLFGVDRLEVTASLDGPQTSQIMIAFWSDNGSVLATSQVGNDQSLSVRYHDGIAAEGLPVTAERPIAIRITSGPMTLQNLEIKRLIEYRLRPGDDRDQFPLRINSGHCYVLGDNVPVSIDSRELGQIPMSRIEGRVRRLQRGASMPDVR